MAHIQIQKYGVNTLKNYLKNRNLKRTKFQVYNSI